ncbi:hypothetical protein G7047_19250 [Diaphorobacter sp. HDW4A]|uniref:hypothetical protein n=1 Tax=Diaphorobacter sp. HDW4A TaxID=2714924 RepID=UPI00140B2A69|nr:hypothetical protein [Diaphorobacter sp. HDW4A]QIL81815.1 hypothetical protein G7047_19250 [Diaphorobacter sp. HDW4A]
MATSQQIIKRVFSPAAYVGPVYARRYGSAEPFLSVGNVLSAEMSHKEDVEQQTNMTTLGGGVHAERRRVSEVGLSFKFADLNVANYSRAVMGTASGIDSGTVSAEAHKVTLGGLLATAHLLPQNVVIRKPASGGPATQTVTDESHPNKGRGDTITFLNANPSNVVVRTGADSATATELTMVGNYTVTTTGILIAADAPGVAAATGFWVSYKYPTGTVIPAEGNYEVRPAGIYILPEATALADQDDIVVDYEFASYAKIEALVTKAVELEFIIEGLNEADDGKVSVLKIFRASQGVASKISLLQEKGFADLEVSGTVLMDSSKSGTGISKYYQVLKN